AAGQSAILMGLAVLVVFMLLAALYESWAIPLSVMLAVPLGMLGSVLLVSGLGMPNDVYFQVGIVTVIGLSAKNAILIVEFAKDAYARGATLVDATLEAARLRFRPILMTSFAFVLGVVPLATSTGAGAASQNAVGLGVLGGMLAATPWSVSEERDSDCGVCQGCLRTWRHLGRCHSGSRPPAFPSYLDDLLRLCAGCGASGYLHRCGCCQPERSGSGRAGRYVGRNAVGCQRRTRF